MPDEQELKEQILVCASILNLSPAVIEKDYHLTRAIHTLAEIQNPTFQLVFQGGTALSKAHRITSRMSEDCDFRIKPLDLSLSKSAKQKKMRLLREAILEALQENHFVIDKNQCRIRNESNYMGFYADYRALFPFDEELSLSQSIKLEFFMNEVKSPTENKTVTTLIQTTLGDDVRHATKNVTCMSVEETAAEKWVALTRRVASQAYHPMYQDVSLVRHIYDLHEIIKLHSLSDNFINLVTRLVAQDQKQFKQHNPKYTQNPSQEIQRALKELREKPKWRENWHQFMDVMVFHEEKPAYDVALNSLDKLSEQAIKAVKLTKFIDIGETKTQEKAIETKLMWQHRSLKHEWEQLKTIENKQINWLVKYYELAKQKHAQKIALKINTQCVELMRVITKDKTLYKVVSQKAPHVTQHFVKQIKAFEKTLGFNL